MSGQLSQRGWTAAGQPAPCVLCQQPAILRSPRGRACHWTCALTWTQQHQPGQAQENRTATGRAAPTRAA
jgi:hypothetical protein